MRAMPKATTPATTAAPAAADNTLPLGGAQFQVRNLTRSSDAADPAKPLATVELVFSSGATGKRYDWARDRYYNEELVIDSSAIRLARLQRGAPLLDSHASWRLADTLGVVDQPTIANGLAKCTATFSRRDAVAPIVQDVADNILRNLSVGYIRHAIEMIAPATEGALWTYRVIDWEPMEVSIVPIPFDMDAQFSRSANGEPIDDNAAAFLQRTFPCHFSEPPTAGAPAEPPTPPSQGTRQMPGTNQTAASPTTPAVNQTTTTPAATQAAPTSAAPATRTHTAEQAATIAELCTRHSVPAAELAGYLRNATPVDEVRTAILDRLASNPGANTDQRNVTGTIQITQDEFVTRIAGMQEAMLHRADPKAQLTDNGRRFRGYTMLELARDYLERCGIRTEGMDRMEIAGRALHHRSAGAYMGTGDFANIFANLANKRLRTAYEQVATTYQLWARQAPAVVDFKPISVIQLGAAPELLQTNEFGEFQYGSMADTGETYKVATYGRIVAMTRQMLVNDDLRAFDRLATAFGNSARRLENRLVYAQITGNPTMADGVALFHATHGNLGTGAGSALSFDALDAGRTAMRTQKGLQGETLNVSPAYLLSPAKLEQKAYQLTSSNYVPAKQTDVNEFRAGGRTAVEPIVEPLLDLVSTTGWYFAADGGQIDTVEYCYLGGAEGPVIETQQGFEIDGMAVKARLDFAAKVIDHRGLYRGDGA